MVSEARQSVGAHLVDKDEDGLLGRELDALADDAATVSSSADRCRRTRRIGRCDDQQDAMAARKHTVKSDGTKYFFCDESEAAEGM